MKRIILALCTVALAAGCATTPIRYLTLNMAPSGTIPEGRSIVINSVEVSDALRRPELLVQARKTEIEYYSDTHWVSDLSELVTEKFEAEFNSAQADADAVLLQVRVWQFSEDETADPRCGHVKLSVSGWMTGTPGRDDPDWSRAYEERVPVEGPDVSDVAAALSDGLELIALQISDDIAKQE